MLCLTLTGPTMEKNEQTLKKSGALADVLELRLDCIDCKNQSELKMAELFPSLTDKPVILTCRRKSDGGLFTSNEINRFKLIKKVSKGNFSYVDLESDLHKKRFEKSLAERKIVIIKSYHNTAETPSDFIGIFKRLCTCNCIPKLSVKINKTDDLIALYKFSQTIPKDQKHILIGMGNFGVPSRILYKKFGSFLTYCSDREIAPGMLNIKDMKNLYRADKVTDKTDIFAVIGNPVLHSKSPSIHNSAFRKIGFDGVYIPCETDDCRKFITFAELVGLNGFSVTAPFKTEIIPYLGIVSDECKKTGACNTVVRAHNTWKGLNTDYMACEKLFSDAKKKNVIVLGAGGAARALVSFFVSKKSYVTVFNRTEERAQATASCFGCKYDSIANLKNYSKKADIVIRAVSTNTDNAKALKFEGSETVCDLYYKPEMTSFLKRAQKEGCRIITGLDFLLEQAKFQFKAFTGTPFP